jgi:hypothetical protein
MLDAIKRVLSVPTNDVNDLIRYEAKIGGQLFGPVPDKHRREFFCLDEHTWVWHEEWPDKTGRNRKSITTRYDVRPNGVYKTMGGGVYYRIRSEEQENLYQAAKLYYQKVMPELEHLAGQT